MTKEYALLIIAAVALSTFATRVFPFLFFRNGKPTPKVILYLGRVLPPAVMSMLIVYCLRSVSFLAFPFGLPEIIAVAVVVLLHLWKRNNLISILGGTAVYMILVQFVFI